MWSLDQLEEKVVAMRELYNMYEEGDSGIGLDDVVDPLVDFEQHALIGEALRGVGHMEGEGGAVLVCTAARSPVAHSL